MNRHKFVCPECKHEWSEEFGFESEVMCHGCETVWRLAYDTYDVWPLTAYWIDERSDDQPKFDFTLDGVKIPGCMWIKIERETHKAHSQERYWMTATFFDEVDGSLGHGDVEIKLRGHPEVSPMSFSACVVQWHDKKTLLLETDGVGYESAYQQMKSLWEKSNP